MNFAKIHKEALNRGIEQKEPEVKSLTPNEVHLQNQHNDWLKHPDTRAFYNYCIQQRMKFLQEAQIAASISDLDSNKIRASLCKAKGIEIIINFINNYGKFDTNRDSATGE